MATARQKVTLSLSQEALAALADVATERKRGEFVSTAIIEWVQRRRAPEGGILERVESRLIRIEDVLSRDAS